MNRDLGSGSWVPGGTICENREKQVKKLVGGLVHDFDFRCVKIYDSYRTIAWRSSRYPFVQICRAHDPGVKPSARGVLAAIQA